jgi:hypothetical protein
MQGTITIALAKGRKELAANEHGPYEPANQCVRISPSHFVLGAVPHRIVNR